MDKIIKDIQKTNLADTSKTTYISRIKSYYKLGLGREDIIEVLEKANPKNHLNSEINNISNILQFYEISDTFKKLIKKDEITELRILNDNLKVKQKEKENEPRDNDIDWKDILELKDNLNRPNINNNDRIIYLIYTELDFIPRNDLTPLKIVDKKSDVDDEYNYFVRSTGDLILNQYKTRHKYGVIEAKIPKLNNLLDKHQEWLFENKNGEPLSENALQKKIAFTFKKLSAGKKITINTLRRSYATYIQSLPLKERTAVAHKMGHSSSTSKDRYALDKDAQERIKELE